MKRKAAPWLDWLLCAGWMAVIFAMSAAPGDVSGEQSGMLARLLGWLLGPVFPSVPLETVELLIRKAAHMTEYAVLFLLYRRALSSSGVRHAAAAAFAMAVLYAATDEFHQAFVPGRGPAVTDVLIDACGAGAAWCLCAMTASVRKKE